MEKEPGPGDGGAPRAVVPLAAAAAVLLAWHALYAGFFPTPAGTVGHDYSNFLPMLLDGVYWQRENPWWRVPWFTPSFCGGVPVLANPESSYYSLPQWLGFLVDPLRAVYATALVFTALGFAGTALLLRRGFGSSREGACLGGALFALNGFFAHRMLIGHLTFHAFMLVPLVGAWLLAPARSAERRWEAELARLCALALALAYPVLSGMVNGVLPAGLALVMLVLLHAVVRPGAGAAVLALRRAALALPLAAALCAAKLAAALAYTAHFPRDLYRLPGVPSAWDAIVLPFRALFFGPPTEQARAAFVDVQWLLERHELEYGLTPVALALPLAALALRAPVFAAAAREPRRAVAAALLLALAAVPLALNYHAPGWNAALKSLPLLGSSSFLVRFWASYLPAAAVLAALALDALPLRARPRQLLAALAGAAAVAWHAGADREFYRAQQYRPAAIREAWAQAAARGAGPPVVYVDVYRNAEGRPVHPLSRNDMLVHGVSQLACRHALFGYRLERFPREPLQPGPALADLGGVLNLKNPACYVHPDENGCRPGDHFSVSDRVRAERFASRRPFRFATSRLQAAANLVNASAAIGLPLLLAAAGLRAASRRRAQS